MSAVRDALAGQIDRLITSYNDEDAEDDRAWPEYVADNLLAREPLASLLRVADAAREITPDWDNVHCFSCHYARPCAHDALRDALAALPKEADRG